MLHLRFESWSIAFPEEWKHEIEDDILVISPPGGGGALQIGSMSKNDGAVSEEDLWEFMEESGVDASDIERVLLGDFEGLSAATEDDDTVLRYWVLRNGDVLLLATFSSATAPGDLTGIEDVLKSLKTETKTEAPATLN